MRKLLSISPRVSSEPWTSSSGSGAAEAVICREFRIARFTHRPFRSARLSRLSIRVSISVSNRPTVLGLAVFRSTFFPVINYMAGSTDSRSA